MVDTDTEENWATEETQKKIYTLLKDTYKGVKLKDLKDVLKNIEKNSSELAKINKDFTNANQKLSKTLTSATNVIGGGGGPTAASRGGGGGPASKNIGNSGLNKAMAKATNLFSHLGKSVGGTTGSMALLATGAGMMGNWIHKSTAAFKDLYQFSDDFGGSLVGMQRAATAAGMTLDTFQAVLTKHSTTVANVGLQSFSAIQNGARKLNNEFGNFGISIEGINDIAAEYMETQLLSGQFEKLDDQQHSKALGDYTVKLNALSKATGKRIDQILEENKQSKNNISLYQFALMTGKKELVSNVNKLIDNVGSALQPFMASAMNEITIAGLGGIQTETTKLLHNAGLGDLMVQLANQNDKGDIEGAKKTALELQKQIMNNENLRQMVGTRASVSKDDQAAQDLTAAMQQMDLAKKSITKAGEVATKTADQIREELREEAKKDPERAGTNALLQLEDTVERIKSSAEKVTAETVGQSALSLAKMLDPLQDAIIDNIDAFNDLTTKFGDFMGGSGLMDVINVAIMGLMGLSSALDIAKLAGGNFGGVFKMLGGILGPIISGFGSLFSILGPVANAVFSVGKFFIRFLGPIGLAISVAMLLVEHWDKVVAVFDWGVNKFKEIFPNAGKVIMDGAQKIFEIFTFVPRMIIDLLKKIPLVGDAIEGMQNLGKQAVGAVADMFSSNDSKTTEISKEPTVVSRDIQPIIKQTTPTATQNSKIDEPMHSVERLSMYKEAPNMNGIEDVVNVLEKQSRILEKMLISNEMIVRNTKSGNYTTMGGKPGA